jgi:hypothetical protein
MLGRMVAPKMRRIFKDGGREVSMSLITLMIFISPAHMHAK